MKNKFLSLLCISTISVGMFAGTDLLPVKGRGKSSPKMFIGLSVGAGLPMGNFGKSTKQAVNDSTVQGYAKTGIYFNLSAGYKLSNLIGVMIQLGGNLNGFNSVAYDANANNPAGTTVGTSHYIGSYLVGPYLGIPVGDKLSVNVRVLGGLMTDKFSSVTSTLSPGSALQQTFNHQYAPAMTFGYDAGAGLTVHATERIGIALNVDYLGGTPTFTKSTETYTGPLISTVGTRTDKWPLSVGIVNVSLGLVVRF